MKTLTIPTGSVAGITTEMSRDYSVEQLQYAYASQKRLFKAALHDKDYELARRLVPYLDLTRNQLFEAMYREKTTNPFNSRGEQDV